MQVHLDGAARLALRRIGSPAVRMRPVPAAQLCHRDALRLLSTLPRRMEPRFRAEPEPELIAAPMPPGKYWNDKGPGPTLVRATQLWDGVINLLPKGFGRAPGTEGGKKDGEEGASSTADSNKEGADKESGGSGSGGDGGNKKKGKKEDEERSKQIEALLASASAAALLFFMLRMFGDSRPEGAEISWQEFRNTFLASGMVDRLEVINKEYVRVYLRNTPHYGVLEAAAAAEGGGGGGGGVTMAHGGANSHHGSDRSGSSSSHGGSGGDSYASSSGTGAGGGSGDGGDSLLGSGLLSPEREAELRRAMEVARTRRPLFFRIGSVDGFERQLEDAQLDMGTRPRDFVLVRHVTETDLSSRLGTLAPTLLLLGGYFLLYRFVGGGGGLGGAGGGLGGGGGGGGIGRMFSIGKAKPAVVNKDSKVKVTFKDVAGCDEAKAEIMEFVQFLKDPSRFTALGAKIPKGALLVGPPGTGKTLLAKATAGESGTPFFSMSGSDFIEMFVGVGPSRVRDLFAQARAAAPCIIFIDEIDAVARARNKGGFSGGNDERENTLNQLLVEMDGFSSTEGVVVLAGTNRADILDKAILRPGRFDRQITVDKPDIGGRVAIFRVHMAKIKVAGDPETYAQRLAALTPGFVGADIANICNEAAIHAARGAKTKVDLKDFEAAIDRVIGGLERRNSLMTQEEKRTVAFHEAGHAIAGWFLEHADPLLKVTIIPRGNGALGFAQYLPKEVTLYSREALMDRMCMALGGRAAEELTFDGRITTGAQDDLDKVTQMAYAMTAVYGMNERIGTLSFPKREENMYDKPYSEATAQVIDDEVRKLVDGAYKRTKALLGQHAEALRGVAELLLARETINQNDLVAIAGARPWGINAQLKPYVDMMYDEEKEKEENKEGEKAKEGGADSTGASTSGAPGTDAAAPASASTETAPIGAAGEKKE